MMRYRGARSLSSIAQGALITALLAFGTQTAHAQVPVGFDGSDWTIDRGNVSPFVGPDARSTNGNALREGYNEFFNSIYNDLTNKFTLNPGPGTPRYVWPFTRDLTRSLDVNFPPTGSEVDNFNPFYPTITRPDQTTNPALNQKQGWTYFPDSKTATFDNTGAVTGPSPFTPYPKNVLVDPNNGWTTTNVAFGSNKDYRSTNGGTSFLLDPTITSSFDYLYTIAVQGSFQVPRNGTSTPATDAELHQLPNASPLVYSVVHNALVNAFTNKVPIAQYTSGLLASGRYYVDIYSPGSGTATYSGTNVKTIHDSVKRAFVRVSWKNTYNTANNTIIEGTGAAGAGGVNDPVTSRIFLVDFGQAGWIRIGSDALGPAAFPFLSDPNDTSHTRGDPASQLVVTIYALTADDLQKEYVAKNRPLPVVTADAVQFTSVTVGDPNLPLPTFDKSVPKSVPDPLTRYVPNANNPNQPTPVFRISPAGRILAATNGFNNSTDNPSGKVKMPEILNFNGNPNATTTNAAFVGNTVTQVTYVAREELKAESDLPVSLRPLRSHVDPTQDTSNTNPLTTDPTALTSQPVFYALDNRNGDLHTVDQFLGDTDPTTNSPFFIRSFEKVIWRYEGIPDSANFLNNVSNAGTVSASALLANVRCRDGVVRQILYFVTTNPDGSLGHIYALDPRGAQASAGNFPLPQATTAYWVYPSFRPLVGTEPGSGNANYGPPAVYQDPNYTLPTGFVRTGYPASTWPNDTTVYPGLSNYDGDLVARTVTDSNNVQHQIVTIKSDTQVPFGGIQGSPLLIDDPDYLYADPVTGVVKNPFAPQLLVVPGRNGRIYAFDAGGRGDFGALADGTLYSGTTKRVWTWPRVGGDTFHAAIDKGLISAGQASKYDTANPFANDKAKGGFFSSPAFRADPLSPNNPILAGSEDGHLYAIGAGHDTLSAIVNGQPAFNNRLRWQYPDDNTNLGSQFSTPTLFQPTDTSKPSVAVFTVGGRVYAVPEFPSNGTTVNAPIWVWPYTTNPPQPNPGDANSVAIEGGFGRSAPMVIKGVGSTGQTLRPTQDTCYVVAYGNGSTGGTVYALDAAPTNATLPRTTVLGTGITEEPATTDTSPSGTVITPQSDLIDGTVVAASQTYPALVTADYNGGIYAMGLKPVAVDDGTGTNTNVNILPLLWRHYDSLSIRTASAMLCGGDQGGGDTWDTIVPSRGLIVEGDAGGQLYAYGYGTGTGGTGSTTGPGERAERRVNGDVSIDLRVLDFYNQNDYNLMMKVPDPANPIGNVFATIGLKPDGSKFSKTKDPVAGNLGADKSIGVDWGEYIYIVAWGVYHGQPTDVTNATIANGMHGVGPPSITVTFTIAQNGRGSKPYTVSVPAFVQTPARPDVLAGQAWPDDAGLTVAEKQQLSIYGIDPLVQGGDLGYHQLTGPDNHVYPWIAKYKIHIRPDAQTPYTPGSLPYQVTARATIRQTVFTPTSGSTQQSTTQVRGDSNILRAGQRDLEGKANSPTGITVNQRGSLGPARGVYIANPLGLTVRGPSAIGNPNEIGWYPNSVGSSGGGTELLGNGNSLADIGAAIGSGTMKALFAPFGLIESGSSATYKGVSGNTSNVSALYVMDRSDLYATTGRGVSVGALVRPLRWLGGPSSVMNPLPWEKLPADAADTVDYPNIGTENVSLTTAAGQSLLASGGADVNVPVGSGSNRVAQATELLLTANVPKFQPANVNRGSVSYSYNNKNYTFGSNYLNIAGQTMKNILGPLDIGTGAQLASGDSRLAPSAGYVSEVVVYALSAGSQFQQYLPSAALDAARGDGTTNVTLAHRVFETGLAVPPTTKLRMAEQTIDLGKLPHGTGYSPLTSTNVPYYASVFAPAGLGPWRDPSTGVSPTNPNSQYFSPWDNEQGFGGSFFRPFTLINESNINLVDVRLAKLIGPVGGAIDQNTLSGTLQAGSTLATWLSSDEVDETAQPLFTLPFLNGNAGVGNIGMVSSFDHPSSSSAKYAENPLWKFGTFTGLYNPFVSSSGITNAVATPSGEVNALLGGWSNNSQGQPTVHKPRPGDSQGTVATAPDVPYDWQSSGSIIVNNFQPLLTKVGLAIPVGTPSGTYTTDVIGYEDNTPIQWREWLGQTNTTNIGADHDGILNVAFDQFNKGLANANLEFYTDPGFTLKVTSVHDARLTNGVSAGTLSQLDPSNILTGDINGNVRSANLLPAVLRVPLDPNANVAKSNIVLFFTTNREYNGSTLQQSSPAAPYQLAYSVLSGTYTQGSVSKLPQDTFDFGYKDPGGTSNPITNKSQWWTPIVNADGSNVLFPGISQGAVQSLFPSTPNANVDNPNGLPYLPGKIATDGNGNVPSVRYASPAVALNQTNPYDGSEAYLFFQGTVDKQGATVAAANGAGQQTDTRTFYVPLLMNGSSDLTKRGTPDFSGTPPVRSLLNDPALSKLSPKPLLVKLPQRQGTVNGRPVTYPAINLLYLFWHSGNTSQTSLYYNVNSMAGFPSSGWTPDQKLPAPSALAWQSDPYPVYRQILDENGNLVDAIDIVYTGSLKSRQAAEVLLTRYVINRTTPTATTDPKIGALNLVRLPPVKNETMARIGGTNTWAARDAGWVLRILNDNSATNDDVAILMERKGQIFYLNVDANGRIRGRYDPASGLVYYDCLSRFLGPTRVATDPTTNKPYFGGGQLVVDLRSGTVSFPNVPPASTDKIFVAYTPQVMRLNVSRDQNNFQYTTQAAFPDSFIANAGSPAIGDHTTPIAFVDRSVNPRTGNVFTNGNQAWPTNTAGPAIDRYWSLYRRSDSAGKTAGIYYKAMRLMARLPYPVKFTVSNGNRVPVTQLKVTGAVGPYEVDYVRGRIYFTEVDEGNTITVTQYTGDDGSPNGWTSNVQMSYTVAWADEISGGGSASPGAFKSDPTISEAAMPTDSPVNEGQVAAFLDPYTDKVWVFWTSTRNGTSDLYYQTLAPQFYSTK